VQISEQVFQRGKGTVRPLCSRLGLRPGGYSRGVEKAVVDFGAEDSFALAAERLSRHHPVKLSASSVRSITLDHAGKMQERQSASGSVGVLPARGAAHLIAEADGTMLPVVDFCEGKKSAGDRRKNRSVRWTETRLCAVRPHGQVTARYGCDGESVEALGYRWAHCAARAGWALESHIHVVSDGAAWIAGQKEAMFGTQATQLLDLYHVMEYLSSAQKAHPPWQQRCRRWLQTQKRRLLRGQAQQVVAELAQAIEPLSQGPEAPIRAAWRYLSNHLDKLDYPAARALDLPIGSGMIEGGHRHVLQKRLKLSGSWWSPSNLEAMAQLRICRANQDWDSYWKRAA